MQNGSEPDRSKPCWVLMWRGKTPPKKAQAPGCKLALVEYAWQGDAWRRTDTEEVLVRSFYQAWKKADWVGRLPQMGRKRYAMTKDNYAKVAPLFVAGSSIRAASRATGISLGSTKKLHDFWRGHA